MYIKNKIIKVSFQAGTTIHLAVQRCVDFCNEYKTEIELEFNGVSHTITKFTNQTDIIKGSSNEFEKDLFKLINKYTDKGLKKPDLVKKMEWVLGSCKMS